MLPLTIIYNVAEQEYQKSYGRKIRVYYSPVNSFNRLTRRIFQAETYVAPYEKINRDYGAVVQCSEIRHINATWLYLSNIRAHCA